MLPLFLPLFLLFLLLGFPVFFAMLAAPGIMLFAEGMGRDAALMYRNIFNGIDSFPLMAILFMYAGFISEMRHPARTAGDSPSSTSTFSTHGSIRA